MPAKQPKTLYREATKQENFTGRRTHCGTPLRVAGAVW